MKKFDVSVPRKMFWSKDIGGTGFCPLCQGRLGQENNSYLLIIRESGDIQPLIVGNDGGHFCENCPIVVLDYEVFEQSALIGNRSSRSFEFTVPGMVDFDAMSEESVNIPIGDDDNPIPLVRFTNYRDGAPVRKKRKRGKISKAHRKRKSNRSVKSSR
jgi:hypothetical protein